MKLSPMDEFNLRVLGFIPDGNGGRREFVAPMRPIDEFNLIVLGHVPQSDYDPHGVAALRKTCEEFYPMYLDAWPS